MEWQDLLADGYGRVAGYMESVLNGLNQEDLNWQPKSDSNSIGWLCWHLTRQQDAQVSSLMEEEQLWTKDNWQSKFKIPPGVSDSGFGHTPEQVAAFVSPEPQILLDYQRAVAERSINYFRSLSETDLERELDEPWFTPKPTVGVRLISIMEDSMLHAGQAGYLRGLRQGKGWQKY